MKKRLLFVLLATAMTCSIWGCGAAGTADADTFDMGNEDTQVIEDEEMAVADETETTSDAETETAEQTEPTDVDTTGKNEVYFVSGDSFYTSVELKYNETIQDVVTAWFTPDEKSALMLYETTDKEEYVKQATAQIKERSGEAPLITINEEGTYIQGFTGEYIALMFISEAKKGGSWYVLEVNTVDANISSTMYQLVDDLLASGLTVAESRIKYEEGLNPSSSDEQEGTSADATVDDGGFTKDYDCEYFTSYESDKYSVTVYKEMDPDYAQARDKGSVDAWEGTYKVESVSKITVGETQLSVITRESDGYYDYGLVSDDDQVCITVSAFGGEQIADAQLSEIAEHFLKN